MSESFMYSFECRCKKAQDYSPTVAIFSPRGWGEGWEFWRFSEKKFPPRDNMIGKKNQILHPEANKTQE